MSTSVVNEPKKTRQKDITGQVFGQLTALFPTERRDAKGYVIWHCKCACGSELDVIYNALLYTPMKSCGCQKKEHSRALGSFLKRVDGTCVDMLKSKKVPSNNTTGVKGVYFVKGKYLAKIVFQKKQYTLGKYDDLESAARARREAEIQLNESVVTHYDRWRAKAEQDPQWAAEHPVSIRVKRCESGLEVTCLPAIE